MNEQQIRDLVRSEIQAQISAARFQLNPIQRHVHNGTDSPTVFQPILTYIGYVAHNLGNTVLPAGWSVSGGGGSVYTITHNLNTILYTAIGSASSASGSGDQDTVTTYQRLNSVDFAIANTVTGVLDVCDFWFTLTTVANKSITLPTYNVNFV